MSSKSVRDQITTFLTTQFPTDNIIPDLSTHFERLEDLLDKYGIDMNDQWMAVQYIGSEEIPVSNASNNTKGCYREVGSLFIHVSSPVKDTARDDILNKAEEIRNAFRGQRINNIIINQVKPPNFEAGATLQFEGGFTSCSVVVDYQSDLNL